MKTVDGKQVLCKAGVEVDGASLPHSLYHRNESEALEDAVMILKFLKEANQLCCVADFHSERVSGDFYNGMIHIHNLLLDKLEIAARCYKFPFYGLVGNYPALAEREG